MTNYAENLENYGTVLSSELMAGQGPDVILWNNAPSTSSLGSFSDIYKVMESGSFYNLDNFLANDPDFNSNDYLSEILDNGIYKGERLYMPISYSMNILVSSQETLDQNGISLAGEPSFAEFSKQTGGYCEEIADEYNKYLFDYQGFENPLCDLVYPYNGMQLINYERNEVMVDNEAFRDTME